MTGPGDAKKLARTTDPATSHDGAGSIVNLRAKMQRWAARCVRESPGKTVSELAQIYCPDDPRRINRRLTECDRAGTVVRGEPRRCGVTGRRAAVWYPPPDPVGPAKESPPVAGSPARKTVV